MELSYLPYFVGDSCSASALAASAGYLLPELGLGPPCVATALCLLLRLFY